MNGTIVFTTYDERPVNPCNDPKNEYYTVEEQKGCNFTSSSLVSIGLIYNDVWAYKLCNPKGPNPERGFDTPCKETGWLLWHAGAPQGGALTNIAVPTKFRLLIMYYGIFYASCCLVTPVYQWFSVR